MKLFLKTLSLFILITPVFAYAQYQTLVGIPGVTAGGNTFDSYLQAVYATSISLAALLAVIKIVIAGVKWMTTDIVDSKSSAKKDIEGAILGLVVILAAVLILYIINPNIGAVSLNFAPAPQPPPVATLPDSVQAVAFCTSREAGGCSAHTCDTAGTLTCAEVVANCEATQGFSSVREFGENNIVCITNFTTVTNVDLTGSGIFDESAITTQNQLTTESERQARSRITAELEAAGVEILITVSSATFGSGATAQRAWESRCQRAGGTGITYLLTTSGAAYGSFCTS